MTEFFGCGFAAARPRFGYCRVHVPLRCKGYGVDLKRVHRIYCEEGLNLRLRPRRKRGSHLRGVPTPPGRVHVRWSMDFMDEYAAGGRRFRVLTVVDILSRFSPIIEADFRMQVKLNFTHPGKPVENAYIESFNARVRDECLNTQIFVPLADARSKLDAWRRDYNESRPHTSLVIRRLRSHAEGGVTGNAGGTVR